MTNGTRDAWWRTSYKLYADAAEWTAANSYLPPAGLGANEGYTATGGEGSEEGGR